MSLTAFNNGSRDIGSLSRVYSIKHSMTQMQRKATFLTKVSESIEFGVQSHNVVAARTFNFLFNR